MTRVNKKSSTVRAVMTYAMTAQTLRSPAVGSAVVPAGSSAARYCSKTRTRLDKGAEQVLELTSGPTLPDVDLHAWMMHLAQLLLTFYSEASYKTHVKQSCCCQMTTVGGTSWHNLSKQSDFR